uniref:Uncharacterized protein n=1 Tax=Meloidogyne incognita TaxID=6306 RepID=A0A914M2F1_MELIC
MGMCKDIIFAFSPRNLKRSPRHTSSTTVFALRFVRTCKIITNSIKRTCFFAFYQAFFNHIAVLHFGREINHVLKIGEQVHCATIPRRNAFPFVVEHAENGNIYFSNYYQGNLHEIAFKSNFTGSRMIRVQFQIGLADFYGSLRKCSLSIFQRVIEKPNRDSITIIITLNLPEKKQKNQRSKESWQNVGSRRAQK